MGFLNQQQYVSFHDGYNFHDMISHDDNDLVDRYRYDTYVGVSKNRGTPKWMVYNGKPLLKWMILGGKPTILGNPHVFHGNSLTSGRSVDTNSSPSQVAPPGSASSTAAASAAAKQAAQCGLQATDVERAAVLAVAWKKFHWDVLGVGWKWMDQWMVGINALCFTYLKMGDIRLINPVGLEYPWLDGLKWHIHKNYNAESWKYFVHMDVSENFSYPQIIHFSRIFPL